MHAQSCPTLCYPMDCSPPGSSVHGISQARILEWVAISSSRGSSWPRDQTHDSCVSCTAGRFFTTEPLGKPYSSIGIKQWVCVRDKTQRQCVSYQCCGKQFALSSEADTPLQYSAWKIPWMEEPGRLQSMGSLRVGHDWATSLSLFTSMLWKRKWQPTPVFLPGESQGWGAWWAAVYGVAQSQTRLTWLSSSSEAEDRCRRLKKHGHGI